MPCDTDAFLADIEACHGSAVIGGAEACPAVVAAARAHGAECLHTPMFSNGPPYAYSVCRRGAGAGVREICAAAGHVVGPPAQSQSQPAQAGMSAGAIGAIGATVVVTTVGLVAAGLRVEFKRRTPMAEILHPSTTGGDMDSKGLHRMKFTEWLRGGTPEGQPVDFKNLWRKGLPGGSTRTWNFGSKGQYETWYASRHHTTANESAAPETTVHKPQTKEVMARTASEIFTLNTPVGDDEL